MIPRSALAIPSPSPPPVYYVIGDNKIVYSLGRIITDRPGFHTSEYLFPAGYKSSAILPSFVQANTKIEYYQEIVDVGGPGPMFRITPADSVGNAVEDSHSCTGAWLKMLELISGGNTTGGTQHAPDGPLLFGFREPEIRALIEQLPGATECKAYVSSNASHICVAQGGQSKVRKISQALLDAHRGWMTSHGPTSVLAPEASATHPLVPAPAAATPQYPISIQPASFASPALPATPKAAPTAPEPAPAPAPALQASMFPGLQAAGIPATALQAQQQETLRAALIQSMALASALPAASGVNVTPTASPAAKPTQIDTQAVPTTLTGRPRTRAMAASNLKQDPQLTPQTVTMPLTVSQTVTLLNLGTVVYDRPGFHNHTHIFPAGFRTVKKFYSASSNAMADYTNEIIDTGDDAPVFRVTSSENPAVVVEGSSPSGVWKSVREHINAGQNDRQKSKSCFVNGPQYFGLSHPTVQKLIEQLPNSDRCLRYTGTQRSSQQTQNKRRRVGRGDSEEDEDDIPAAPPAAPPGRVEFEPVTQPLFAGSSEKPSKLSAQLPQVTQVSASAPLSLLASDASGRVLPLHPSPSGPLVGPDGATLPFVMPCASLTHTHRPEGVRSEAEDGEHIERLLAQTLEAARRRRCEIASLASVSEKQVEEMSKELESVRVELSQVKKHAQTMFVAYTQSIQRLQQLESFLQIQATAYPAFQAALAQHARTLPPLLPVPLPPSPPTLSPAPMALPGQQGPALSSVLGPTLGTPAPHVGPATLSSSPASTAPPSLPPSQSPSQAQAHSPPANLCINVKPPPAPPHSVQLAALAAAQGSPTQAPPAPASGLGVLPIRTSAQARGPEDVQAQTSLAGLGQAAATTFPISPISLVPVSAALPMGATASVVAFAEATQPQPQPQPQRCVHHLFRPPFPSFNRSRVPLFARRSHTHGNALSHGHGHTHPLMMHSHRT
eukprot:gnl/Trimastix_PCT/3121.p1 GENE.gnl/Trimastix_PCT/3121~~gnl/Trimastix_PCT/3121.p1  ORF type:complete len:953 (+),score=160.26 gnl/Trimastix_PCT/3121:57-2915(+)